MVLETAKAIYHRLHNRCDGFITVMLISVDWHMCIITPSQLIAIDSGAR